MNFELRKISVVTELRKFQRFLNLGNCWIILDLENFCITELRKISSQDTTLKNFQIGLNFGRF